MERDSTRFRSKKTRSIQIPKLVRRSHSPLMGAFHSDCRPEGGKQSIGEPEESPE
jgi:hypothetical protein